MFRFDSGTDLHIPRVLKLYLGLPNAVCPGDGKNNMEIRYRFTKYRGYKGKVLLVPRVF